MALDSGTHFGPYEILAPIGAGGMGEVYKATDTRLERTVAIKVLPEHLAGSPERKARFEREAKAISQLNHPHICTLYDVGEQDGVDFIVMEYIEGESMAERLARGVLPFDKALEYGIQIADALDKAHRAGIVHRDLKPGNVMLTKSGVKLLDFGLAKLLDGELDSVGSDAPTKHKALTDEQSIIGTLQYMAPEQLERKPTDARTDVFAFGALLYEMLTGRKAFDGNSQASLISAIMKDEPRPISELLPIAPALLERVVLQCLEKDPDERWQSAGDLKWQLSWVGAERSAPVGTESGRRSPLVVALFSIMAAAVAAMATWMLKPSAMPSVIRFGVPAAEGMNFPRLARAIALSPDGKRLAYASGGQLYVRNFDEQEATPLPGTEDGTAPFFSPDGTIVYGIRGSTGLWRVSAAGGTPEALTALEQDIWDHDYPQILPGGESVLFSIRTGSWDDAQIAVYSLETGEQRVLLDGGYDAQYVSTGHIVYARARGLFAVPFDLSTLSVTGDPTPVVEGVWQGASGTQFDISDDGTLAFVPGDDSAGGRTLVWVNRNGEEEPLATPSATYTSARVSPDGGRVAVSVLDFENNDVWVAEVARGTLSKVTTEPFWDTRPLWTPDAQRIVYASLRDGRWGFFSKSADGTGAVENLYAGEGNYALGDGSWARDGTTLVFAHTNVGTGGRDIGMLSANGDGSPQPVLRTEADESGPAISPDGNWIAYASDETGQDEVYIERFPDLGERRRISTAGGAQPVWSPDGRELFYLGDEAMMAVAVVAGPTFTLGTAEALFRIEGYFRREYRVHDIAPDGERFLMIKQSNENSSQINIVVNWTEELERLVPSQ